MDEELTLQELRARAKKRLEGKPVRDGTAEDNAKLVEELTIHQEELNIQNEELRRTQLELNSLRAKYFELYDLAPVSYITLNADLIIIGANIAASALLGSERNHIIDHALSTFVFPVQYELLYLHYRRLAEGKGDTAYTFHIKRADGSDIQVQFESNLVHNGHVTGFRSILTDVTELNEAKELVQRANADLEEKVRERTKELVLSQSKLKLTAEELTRSNTDLLQFAYLASHDLQEPLRMVVSYLSLLERKCKGNLDPVAQEYVERAIQGGERMRELIDDLLTYSRVDAQEKDFTRVARHRHFRSLRDE